MNELPFVKKVMVSLVIIQFIIILFTYFIDTSVSNSSFNPANNQALASMQNSQKAINTSSTNLVNSFSNPILTYQNCNNVNILGFSVSDISCIVFNIGKGFINVLASIMSVIYNIFLLLIETTSLIFTLFAQVIPSLFTSSIFGSFSVVFTIIYGAIITILTIYGLIVFREIVARFIGR